jgi:CRP-like cAMP-binding protein
MSLSTCVTAWLVEMPAQGATPMTIRYSTTRPLVPRQNQNQLLAALPKEIKDQLAPDLERVALTPGEVIYEAGYADRYAYFLNDSVVSLLSITESGKCAEVSVVGSEGVVGIDALVGGSNPCSQAVVQSAGTTYRVPSRLLKDVFNRHAEVRWLVLRYMQSLITQMSQTAVCNRHHSIAQQLCRRLLLSLDRMAGDEVPLTHSMIAYLLGVRREGVTCAANTLRKLGVIEYRRGRIKVLDRNKLERLCCECYAVVKSESDGLLSHSSIVPPRYDTRRAADGPVSRSAA